MKWKTLIHRRVRKAVYRAFRYHWLTERLLNTWERTDTVQLPEVGWVIPASSECIIVDCGANVGDVTSRFVRTGATVHAFEPNPLVFSILAARFRHNSRVVCLNKGVWDRECKLTLTLPISDRSADDIDVSVASSFVASTGEQGRRVEVDCVNLVQYLAALPGRIRLLKMDIEGAEGQVLESLLESDVVRKIDYMVVETHEQHIRDLAPRIQEIRRRIEQLGLQDRISLDWV